MTVIFFAGTSKSKQPSVVRSTKLKDDPETMRAVFGSSSPSPSPPLTVRPKSSNRGKRRSAEIGAARSPRDRYNFPKYSLDDTSKIDDEVENVHLAEDVPAFKFNTNTNPTLISLYNHIMQGNMTPDKKRRKNNQWAKGILKSSKVTKQGTPSKNSPGASARGLGKMGSFDSISSSSADEIRTMRKHVEEEVDDDACIITDVRLSPGKPTAQEDRGDPVDQTPSLAGPKKHPKRAVKSVCVPKWIAVIPKNVPCNQQSTESLMPNHKPIESAGKRRHW